MAQRAELAFTMLLPAFSALYIWQCNRVPEPPGNIVVGPRDVPLLIGWVMLSISLLLVFLRFRRGPSSEGPESEAAEDDTTISDWPAVWLVLVSFLLLILLLEYLGFVLATGLFVSSLSTVFAHRRWLLNLCTGFGFAIVFYLIFTRLLSIQLPGGILGS